MDRLLAIGVKHGIPIIEDAAEAIGSVYHGKRAGSMGRFGSFSFHGTKTLTTGEGGMFVTNDDDLYETVLTLSNHGRARGQKKQFWPDMVGFKYKMSNIQAAIGCAQMERIETLINRKRQILQYYKNAFSETPGLTLNPVFDEIMSGAWMPTVVFNPKLGVYRDGLLNRLAEANIDARVFFWPLSQLGLVDSVHATPLSQCIADRAINLPSFHDITIKELEQVVATIIQEVHY